VLASSEVAQIGALLLGEKYQYVKYIYMHAKKRFDGICGMKFHVVCSKLDVLMNFNVSGIDSQKKNVAEEAYCIL
jgi:hypothetical protein